MLVCALTSVCIAGCGLSNGARQFTSSVSRLLPGNPGDTYETFNDPNRVDANQEQMMLDARKGLSASREPDKWWSDSLHSAQARSIERSLGVEYY